MDVVYAVTREVVQRESVGTTDIPPLYESLDPATGRSAVAGSLGEDGPTRFSYHGYAVSVSAEGDVSVTPVDASQS